MQRITLSRSGEAPLAFDGELIAAVEGDRQAGKEQNRYHCLSLYRRQGGGYVLAIQYRTNWQGELGHDQALALPDAAAVRRALRDYDPAAKVAGFPPHDAYKGKQARLLADVRGRYEAQVSDLLSREEFAEPAEEAARPGRDELGGLYDRWQIAIYRQLLQHGLAEASLTQAEASLICDALNGTFIVEVGDDEPRMWRWWPMEVEDAIRLNRLDAKWEVRAPALLAKVRALSPLGLAAVADAAERFWREHAEEDTAEALRAVGLLRGDDEADGIRAYGQGVTEKRLAEEGETD